MLYSVDFAVRVNGIFHTIHTAFVSAASVSECMDIADSMKENFPENKRSHIHIFVEA